MLRSSHQKLAVVFVLGAFVLRALAPIGYMPSAIGSGLPFELCPDQLPPGYVFKSTPSGHDHHIHGDHGSSDPAQAQGSDNCQVGHLLISAIAVDASPDNSSAVRSSIDYIPVVSTPVPRTTASIYRSRAPPA